MPALLILVIAVVLAAMRWPILNALAGWLVVFPIVTVASGTIAWAVLIQRWDALFSFGGYGATLATFAVPVAIWVRRLNS